MTYTPVTYRVIDPDDATLDYAVRYATEADIADLPAARTGLPAEGLYVRDDIPPPTRVTVDQTRIVIPGNLFQVSTVVTESLGIAPEIFVFKTVDTTFSHVATVSDMDEYPDTYVAAEAAGDTYYRDSEVVVTRTTVAAAISFAEYTLGRVSFLTRQYSTYKLDFEGEDTHVYTAPEA